MGMVLGKTPNNLPKENLKKNIILFSASINNIILNLPNLILGSADHPTSTSDRVLSRIRAESLARTETLGRE